MLACLVLSVAVASAQTVVNYRSPDGSHPLTNMPAAGEITTGFLLPTYPEKKFPAGKLVDVVVGIRNDGSETYNLTMIAGSLNSPADFNLHVQNFSNIGYGQMLAPGEEVSLEYKFFPDGRLEPRDFTVALTVFYGDAAGGWYSSTFFNETINIVEVKKWVDWELLGLVGLFAVAASGLGYAAYSYVVSMGWLKPQKKRARKARPAGERAPAMTSEDHDDWVKGTPYDDFRKRTAKAASAKAASKK